MELSDNDDDYDDGPNKEIRSRNRNLVRKWVIFKSDANFCFQLHIYTLVRH